MSENTGLTIVLTEEMLYGVCPLPRVLAQLRRVIDYTPVSDAAKILAVKLYLAMDEEVLDKMLESHLTGEMLEVLHQYYGGELAALVHDIKANGVWHTLYLRLIQDHPAFQHSVHDGYELKKLVKQFSWAYVMAKFHEGALYRWSVEYIVFPPPPSEYET